MVLSQLHRPCYADSHGGPALFKMEKAQMEGSKEVNGGREFYGLCGK